MFKFCLCARHVREEEREADVSIDSSHPMQVAGLPRTFSHNEIMTAIGNSPIPVGEGGYGSVFKGVLGGSTIAVKMINEVGGHGDRTFLSEIASIASVQHTNLVRLLGYCLVKGGYRYLVYNFFKNGSLDKWIFCKGVEGELCLPWALRFQVAKEVADALAYLHHRCSPRILHLDIKPENILLDDDFHARVSDFGLSRLMERNESSIFTKQGGTWGYLSPECFQKKVISEKSDVYSYGMMLLELVGGRRNVIFKQNCLTGYSYFPKIVSEKMREYKLMTVVDERLLMVGGVQEKEVNLLVYVALWCVQEDLEDRPSMERVVSMLKGSVSVSMPPETRMFVLDYLSSLDLDTTDHGTTQDASDSRISTKSYTLPTLFSRQSLLEGDDDGVASSYLMQVARMPRQFQHKHIKAAIRNFPIPVGNGGSGSVFKGVLGGSTIAVKKINGLFGGQKFIAEIASIASVQHKSLIRLLGYCLVKGSPHYLVYDFFKNGSLDTWIFCNRGEGGKCLNWALRYQVAEDVADVLAYLHHRCSPRIIHHDIRPENILLDNNLHARVTDIVISRLMGRDESSLSREFDGFCEMLGYIPRDLKFGEVPEQSDVYSYGMLLLELVGGRRNFVSDKNGHSYFPDIVRKELKEDNIMEVVDERLLRGGEANENEVKVLVYVALCCMQENPQHRPSMELVVSILRGIEPVSLLPMNGLFRAQFHFLG